MSKSTERVKIEIGFDGGQALNALIEVASADKLEKALADGIDGALSLESDDGHTIVVTRKIVYVKRLARESRLGFGD